MAYSELIKNFSKIREYMRQFYVYGFKSRNDISIKSVRSYDNERRRIESWLGDYVYFRQEDDGKIVFMSIDSRRCEKNPLYTAYKTKSFTEKDITFHFYILDLLSDKNRHTITDILDSFDSEYLYHFSSDIVFDESNVRKKLKEYVKIGLIKEEKRNRELVYSINEDSVNTESFKNAVCFFSQENPLGVIGSYILDKYDSYTQPFRFKHHYIFQSLDSEVLYDIVTAMNDDYILDVKVNSKNTDSTETLSVYPHKIYLSTQNGRQYLLCYDKTEETFIFIRLDNIVAVSKTTKETDSQSICEKYQTFKKYLWGVSVRNGEKTDSVRMVVNVETNEQYIAQRLYKEKRCGKVEKIDDTTYEFTAQVYDALELLPWVRTFIGRIKVFECSDKYVQQRFFDDISKLYDTYGGEN